MTLVFRDLSAGLILLVPSVFPVMVVFGLMGWLGVTIDVGTIMTPTVALGVSVDDVVHFLIWYRRGLSEGKSRHDFGDAGLRGLRRAMYQSWSVLGLGLAVFALSSFVPTQRFGAMMFCLLTAALIGNLLIVAGGLVQSAGVLFRPRPGAQGESSASDRTAVAGRGVWLGTTAAARGACSPGQRVDHPGGRRHQTVQPERPKHQPPAGRRRPLSARLAAPLGALERAGQRPCGRFTSPPAPPDAIVGEQPGHGFGVLDFAPIDHRQGFVPGRRRATRFPRPLPRRSGRRSTRWPRTGASVR